MLSDIKHGIRMERINMNKKKVYKESTGFKSELLIEWELELKKELKELKLSKNPIDDKIKEIQGKIDRINKIKPPLGGQ